GHKFTPWPGVLQYGSKRFHGSGAPRGTRRGRRARPDRRRMVRRRAPGRRTRGRRSPRAAAVLEPPRSLGCRVPRSVSGSRAAAGGVVIGDAGGGAFPHDLALTLVAGQLGRALELR